MEVFKGLLPGHSSVAFYVEQTVDIPVPRSGGLPGSRPGQGSAASLSHSGAADEAGQGFFFSHFSAKGKKCTSSSELSSHQMLGSHLGAPEQLGYVPLPQIAEKIAVLQEKNVRR